MSKVALRVFYANLDVVEIDEDCNLETCFCHVNLTSLLSDDADLDREVDARDGGFRR